MAVTPTARLRAKRIRPPFFKYLPNWEPHYPHNWAGTRLEESNQRRRVARYGRALCALDAFNAERLLGTGVDDDPESNTFGQFVYNKTITIVF